MPHLTHRLLRVLLVALLPVATLAVVPAETTFAAHTPKVAVIVGPTGSLTSFYKKLARQVVAEAEAAGARVAKAFSPNAYPWAVKKAVKNANIVVYFGHGSGFPNPYNATLDPTKTNGWGLQGPNAHGTNEDSWANGTLKYYGERWIRTYTDPAPGWVMIYSQACYAPGASEPGRPDATWSQAWKRVTNYSKTPLRMGNGAYFATDHGDAERIVANLLNHPSWTYREVFKAESGYSSGTLRKHSHSKVDGRQVWLSPSGTVSKPKFTYAFAGRPSNSPAANWRYP